MSKRGNNIYKRKDGRWEGRILQNNDFGGKRKYISVYGKTYREVKEKTEHMRLQVKSNVQRSHSDILMNEAADIWVKDKGAVWKPSTYSAYQNILQKYIIPHLGEYRLSQINNHIMELFLSNIRLGEHGKSLSNRYLHSICNMVLMILVHVKKKRGFTIDIPENPVVYVKSKQLLLPTENTMMILEEYLIENIKNDSCLGILIAFYTGIRIGELCALTWEDIDLSEEIIYIHKNVQRVTTHKIAETGTEILFQEPKTVTSTRVIPIPPVLLPYLKENKSLAGGYIVKGKRKSWAEPRTLQYRFAKILKDCNIQNFHFHMLRHAFATRCIDGGFDVKSLSEILGHSNVQVTMNLYVHSTIQHKKQLMKYFSAPLKEKNMESI